ncbi:MAG: PilZ domain-containing protein [Deltaproteobacteria bacterium]|nr:PilZ domain-containing protein [Deltaproteobacteria bacterium]
MQILRARYKDTEAFLAAYQGQFLHGGLFIPTRAALRLSTQVLLDVRFPELRSKVLVRGVIAWRRPGRHRMGLRAGVGLEFLASERHTREFLLAVARGDVVDLVQRRHRRLPVELDVAWRTRDVTERYISRLDDIGEGGAFIHTRRFMSVGSLVMLEVMPPGGQAPMKIEGRVARTHHTEGEEGLGIEFRCRDSGGVSSFAAVTVAACDASESSFGV